MKKFLPFLFLTFILCQAIYSQTTENIGKPIAEIFTDFHYNFNDTSKTTGFGMNRAHLGYKFLPLGNFTSTIIINVGTPDDLAEGSKPKRYGFFREASVTYSKEKLNLSFGITNTRIFDFQQRFWGKRYIASEYQSLYGYGFVADLGIVLDYIMNDIIKFDVSVLNGEGYTNIQRDNNFKTSLGFTITPTKELAIRLYGDIMKTNDVSQVTLVTFAGFKNDFITIGAEGSYKSNLDLIPGDDVWGISGTGSISILKKTEFFARYDYSTSVILPGDIFKWNYLMDKTFVIVGVQYMFTQNVKIALNYQGTFSENPAKKYSDAIFINGLFRF